MKRMETLAKHRQTSEAAVLQMNRKHVLGLQAEVQRIDKEKVMREKYLVFEKSLLYARLDKIQQRQVSLGLIKTPLSRTTPHSVQKRLQSRRLMRIMRQRAAAAAAAAAAAGGQGPGIFLTTGDATETKPVKGLILPPVQQRKNKEGSEKAALNSSKYAPSWLDLPDATTTVRRLSGRSLPKIEEKPEIDSPLKKTPPSRGLPPIDIVHIVSTPIVTSEDRADSPDSGGVQDETRLSGHGTETVNGDVSHPGTGQEKGHELTNGEETRDVSGSGEHEEDVNNNGVAIQSSADQSTAENGEQNEINNKLRRLSLDKDNDKTNRSRSLDATVSVEKTKSLRPQSAPGLQNNES